MAFVTILAYARIRANASLPLGRHAAEPGVSACLVGPRHLVGHRSELGIVRRESYVLLRSIICGDSWRGRLAFLGRRGRLRALGERRYIDRGSHVLTTGLERAAGNHPLHRKLGWITITTLGSVGSPLNPAVRQIHCSFLFLLVFGTIYVPNGLR